MMERVVVDRMKTAFMWMKHNPGMTLDEALEIADDTQYRLDQRWSNIVGQRMSSGTGSKSLARMARKVEQGGRLVKAERSAIQRAVKQGKHVPQILIDEIPMSSRVHWASREHEAFGTDDQEFERIWDERNNPSSDDLPDAGMVDEDILVSDHLRTNPDGSVSIVSAHTRKRSQP
jgi:hypothetical protein